MGLSAPSILPCRVARELAGCLTHASVHLLSRRVLTHPCVLDVAQAQGLGAQSGLALQCWQAAGYLVLQTQGADAGEGP